jgi:hypothetical protein
LSIGEGLFLIIEARPLRSLQHHRQETKRQSLNDCLEFFWGG